MQLKISSFFLLVKEGGDMYAFATAPSEWPRSVHISLHVSFRCSVAPFVQLQWQRRNDLQEKRPWIGTLFLQKIKYQYQ